MYLPLGFRGIITYPSTLGGDVEEPSMSHAEEVRAYCGKHYIEPARARGDKEIAVRAGDVHKEMGYKNRLPLVCSALGTRAFEETFRVSRKGIEGPLNGATTLFRFIVLP
jgi:hypothetical protein